MLIVILLLVAVGAIAFMTITTLDKKKRSKKKGKFKKAFRYNGLYKFFNDNVLFRKSFRKVVSQISGLSLYNFLEIRMLAVKFYVTTGLVSITIIVIGSIMVKDVIATCLIIMFAMIMRNVLITKRIDDIHYKLLIELSDTLSSIHETYTMSHDVTEAIVNCKRGKLTHRVIEQIYGILTSKDADKKLDEFYEMSPFRLVKTLATTSHLLNDEGDCRTNNNQYAYQQAVLLIKNEVDSDMRKLMIQKAKFSMLEYLPVAPIFVMGLVQSFFTGQIPGTSIVFKGLFGYIARIVIILLAFISYYIITNITSNASVRDNDRSDFVDRLLHKKWFKDLVKQVSPKRLRQKLRIKKLLQNALSMKDEEYIYGSKIITSCTSFLFGCLALFIAISSARTFIYNNTGALSLTGSTKYTVEDEHRLFKTDCTIMEMDELPEQEELIKMYKSVFPRYSNMELSDQASRITKKYETWHNLVWRWWYLLVCYGIAVIGWFIPEAQVMLRHYLVKAAAQEDVLQMQTLIAILMYTPLDTMDVLYWLYRNSAVHRDALLFAYHEYPSDPEKALNRLKSKSAVPEFQQIVDKLLSTISEATLLDAFPDLINQREHIMKIREATQLEAVNKKRRIASPISLAPLAAVIILYVLAPIGIVAFSEFSNIMNSGLF